MGKAGSITQFILKQLFRSADLNALTAELGADPLIGHDETDGTRTDFDIGDPVSGSIGHVVKHIYQREGYKVKTVDASGVVVHTADFTSIPSIDIPVGGIIWWYKNLPGVPSLPSGWVECNGQVLSDPESLLDGQTMPNINGSNYFIRGNATAGVVQSSQNLQHNHTATASASGVSGYLEAYVQHTMYPGSIMNVSNAWVSGPLYSGIRKDFQVDSTVGYGTINLNSLAQVPHFTAAAQAIAVANSGSSEARPTNISMVAIIRVK